MAMMQDKRVRFLETFFAYWTCRCLFDALLFGISERQHCYVPSQNGADAMVLMHEMFKELLHGVGSGMYKNIRLEFGVFRDGIHSNATYLVIVDNFSLGRIGFGPFMRHEKCFKVATNYKIESFCLLLTTPLKNGFFAAFLGIFRGGRRVSNAGGKMAVICVPGFVWPKAVDTHMSLALTFRTMGDETAHAPYENVVSPSAIRQQHEISMVLTARVFRHVERYNLLIVFVEVKHIDADRRVQSFESFD